MPNQFSQRRLDEAVVLLKANPLTARELADVMQVSYVYATQVIAALRKYKLVDAVGADGRALRYRAAQQLYTIPKWANSETVEGLAQWLKDDCHYEPKVGSMFNTVFMPSLVALLIEIQDLNAGKPSNTKRLAWVRKQLVTYREATINQLSIIDSILNNNTWWDASLLKTLSNDPTLPLPDKLEAARKFIKAKLDVDIP